MQKQRTSATESITPQVVLTRPPLRVLLGHICLVLQEDLGRLYVTQGNSQVQQGPAPRIPLVNILSVSEREK